MRRLEDMNRVKEVSLLVSSGRKSEKLKSYLFVAF